MGITSYYFLTESDSNLRTLMGLPGRPGRPENT